MDTTRSVRGPSRTNGDGQRAGALEEVRQNVRAMLAGSEAFRQLPVDEQKELYRSMISLGSDLVERAEPERATALADTRSGADVIESTGTAAARVTGETLRQVGFPEFVSQLIKGVFQAIVDSSIQQMQAYGELLKSVTGSLESFAAKLSDDDAMMYAAMAEPTRFRLVPRKVVDADGKDGAAPARYTLKEGGRDLRRAELAEVLTGYKLKMAQERRGLMREMVFMGINRVVVTDGSIQSKLIFHIDTTSDVKSKDSSSSSQGVSATPPYFSWFGLGGGMTRTSVSTVDVNTTSNMSVDITGDVKVNFKSDYFPLESFAGLYQRLKEEEPQMAARYEPQRLPAQNGPPKPQPQADGGG